MGDSRPMLIDLAEQASRLLGESNLQSPPPTPTPGLPDTQQ